MSWFSCRHKWYPIQASGYTDSSYGQRVKSTILVNRCTKCGVTDADNLYGVSDFDLDAAQALDQMLGKPTVNQFIREAHERQVKEQEIARLSTEVPGIKDIVDRILALNKELETMIRLVTK